MLQESLDNYFIIASAVVGAIPILFNWFYMIESSKGIYITEYNVLKKYVNLSFVFSMVMLVVLWVTTKDFDIQLLNCFKGLSIGWVITVLASLIISGIVKTTVENKRNIRKIVFPCIVKAVAIVVILWLIH